jgi:hypothetical protein
MALGDPVLIDLPNAKFLLSSETGVIIESFDLEVDSKLKEIFDASKGYTVGYVFYDFVGNQSWNAYVNGTTGLALAQPGVAITYANSLGIGANGNGVTSGGVYTKTVKISGGGEELFKIAGTSMQRQNVA